MKGRDRPDNGWVALSGLLGLSILALAPGVAVGVVLAEIARARGISASWALLGSVPAGALCVVALPDLVREATARPMTVEGLAPAAIVSWLVAVPVAWWIWQANRDRTDRLRGGAAARAVERRLGPVLLARRALERRREAAAPVSSDSLFLGRDDLGFGVSVPLLRAHATIVGGSDTGKTNTAAVLLEGHAEHGFGAVVLDGKGGRDLPRLALEMAARHGRGAAIWSIQPFGDDELDTARQAWNPVGEGDATEIKDRIAASEDQTEPYYAAIASRGLLDAAAALLVIDGRVWLDTLADALEDPAALAAAVEHAALEDGAREASWLAGLNDGERSALRGMATRLRTMVRSEGGASLVTAGGAEISLYRALRDCAFVVFTLPQGTYPELVPHVARYALSAINAACGRLEREGRPTRSLLLVDELSAFRGDELAATYERARSAGVRVIAATQSLSNFATVGGDKLLHAALDNSELVVVHRQAVPDATELLGALGGTEESWHYSQHVNGTRAGRVGDVLGSPGSEYHGRTLGEQFRAHPNTIRQLARGQAIVLSHRPAPAVRLVSVNPAFTAATAPRRGAAGPATSERTA